MPPDQPSLDPHSLESVVRAALGRPGARIAGWRAEPLTGGATKTPLWRITGDATVDGTAAPLPWSVVLKRKSHDDARAGAVPEVEAYRTGLLDRITQEGFGLAAPRSYLVEPSPPPEADQDATTDLWLEDIHEQPPGPWSIDRYGLAAYHLGLFNGNLPHGRIPRVLPPAFEVPPYLWLGRGFLGYWLEMMETSWSLGAAVLAERPEDRAAWEHPLIAAHFTERTRIRLQQAWRTRRDLYGALRGLPRTLAHGDAHRRNLISQRMADGGDRTVAVDWAVIGYAPLGEDPGHLTTSSLLVEVDPSRARELDAAVFGRYLDGLEEAGWRLSRRLRDTVRFGYAAHGVLNMGLFVGGGAVAAVAHPWVRRWFESNLNRPLEDLMAPFAALTEFTLDLGDEAVTLGRRLGLL